MTAAEWLIWQAMRVAIPRRFDAEQARDLATTFELRVRGRRAGNPTLLELRIAGGRCLVCPGPAHRAPATATIRASDMIRLLIGQTSWPQLLSSGQLELSGDPFLALRFPSLFRLPASPRRRSRDEQATAG